MSKKHMTTPPDYFDSLLQQGVAKGTMEQVDSEHFRLSDQGKREAEELLATNTEAVEMLMKLTLANITLTAEKREKIQHVFDLMLRQLRNKDKVIKLLFEKTGLDHIDIEVEKQSE